MRETSIVIKTCGADLSSYIQLQSDLLAFGHSAVRVCVPGADLAAFEPVVAPRFELLGTRQLLRGFGWPLPVDADWYSQQLYKLLLAASSPTEACWVLDANTLLLRPLPDPWRWGRVILSLGALQPADRCWFHASARFLGLPWSGPPVSPVNQPLRRSVARAMLRWIARVHRAASPLFPLVAGMVAGSRRGTPFWTEYGLYRSFAFHVAPTSHLYRDGTRDLAYYRQGHGGARLEQWLRGLKRDRPGMVKVYARRPGFRMGEQALRRLCDRIRACR